MTTTTPIQRYKEEQFTVWVTIFTTIYTKHPSKPRKTCDPVPYTSVFGRTHIQTPFGTHDEMAQSNIIRPVEFEQDRIKLGGTRDMGNGGKTVYINYQGEPLRIQTPLMSMPFGLSAWPRSEDGKEDVQPQKYSLELSFKDLDKNEKVKAFYKMLCDMDQRILEEGWKNSEAWFKKQHKSLDVTEAVYKRMLKIRAKNDYPPIFKANVPMKEGRISCDVFDGTKQTIDPLKVNLRNAQVMAILQCSGVWLAGGNFGCSWKVLQMFVVPSKGAIEGFAFSLEQEEEELVTDVANASDGARADTDVDVVGRKEDKKSTKQYDVDDSALFEDEDEDISPLIRSSA